MLATRPTELHLTLAPQRRFEAIDVNTRIAREVHDELGQALTGLKLDLALVSSRLPRSQRLLLDKLQTMADQIFTCVKRRGAQLSL